jgi:hypothetical protein
MRWNINFVQRIIHEREEALARPGEISE